MNASTIEADLRQGLATLGLRLSDEQLVQLLAYLDLLQKWNRVYNLTAVRDPREMVGHHLLDSLAVIGPLQRELSSRGKASSASLLDVGSGAGLPGVVVAICCPAVDVTCVDAVAKKTAFVQQAAVALGLQNLYARHARVEEMAGSYDVVSSRAFASLADFVHWSEHLLAPDGCWLAMKGQQPDAEVGALPPQARVFHVEQLAVPGLGAQRCIVWMNAQID